MNFRCIPRGSWNRKIKQTWNVSIGDAACSAVVCKCNIKTINSLLRVTWIWLRSTSKLIWHTDWNRKNITRDQTDARHTSHLSFSPLQLLQWPLTPLMPANIPSDSVSAGNKCPSFTVCWLIYTNYKTLCSREDDQIVWDESIKSLLSQAIISRYLAAAIRAGAGRARWEAEMWPSCARSYFDAQTHIAIIMHTRWGRDKGCPHLNQVPPPSPNGAAAATITVIKAS